MKKKNKKKLTFNKSTVTNLNNAAKHLIRGGATCDATCNTIVCGTCDTDCGTCMSECYSCPTCFETCRPCDTERPLCPIIP